MLLVLTLLDQWVGIGGDEPIVEGQRIIYDGSNLGDCWSSSWWWYYSLLLVLLLLTVTGDADES